MNDRPTPKEQRLAHQALLNAIRNLVAAEQHRANCDEMVNQARANVLKAVQVCERLK